MKSCKIDDKSSIDNNDKNEEELEKHAPVRIITKNRETPSKLQNNSRIDKRQKETMSSLKRHSNISINS